MGTLSTRQNSNSELNKSNKISNKSTNQKHDNIILNNTKNNIYSKIYFNPVKKECPSCKKNLDHLKNDHEINKHIDTCKNSFQNVYLNNDEKNTSKEENLSNLIINLNKLLTEMRYSTSDYDEDIEKAIKLSQNITPEKDAEIKLQSNIKLEEARNLSFDEKYKWLHTQLDKIRIPFTEIEMGCIVNRDDIQSSSFGQLKDFTSKEWHAELKVGFEGEIALDAGGLSREWFTLIVQQLFEEKLGLAKRCSCEQVQQTINDFSFDYSISLENFRFFGCIVAKSILDKCPIGSLFVPFIYKKLLYEEVELKDIKQYDYYIYSSLKQMKNNSIDNVFFETFEVNRDEYNEGEKIELIHGGKNIKVTDANKIEYIKLRTKFITKESIKHQFNAFLEGFYYVLPYDVISVLSSSELQKLLDGMSVISIIDWRKQTIQKGEFSENHIIIKWWWEILKEMDQDNLSKILLFTTGTSRLPVEGFKSLEANRGETAYFTIQSTTYENKKPWPIAHTCFNRIDLPIYKNKKDMLKQINELMGMPLTGFGFE